MAERLTLKPIFYTSIRKHIISIPKEKKASAPSLQPIITLALLPFKVVTDQAIIASFIRNILTIELLINRLSIPALTHLSSNLPSKVILQFFSIQSGDLQLGSSDAAHLLANSMALFEPRIKSLSKVDELAGWFELLITCIAKMPSSTLLPPVDRKGKGKANAAAMDIDVPSTKSTLDPRTLTQIAKLTSAAHLTQLFTSSSHFASSPRSRPLLARFLLTLLTALPATSNGATKRDEILTLLIYDRSAGSGLLREIWRGWIRSGSLMRNLNSSIGKEGWKDVITSLRQPSAAAQEEWHLLILSVQMYSRVLVTLGDDEFFPSTGNGTKAGRNPLMLEEIASLSGLLRNIVFALYWSSDAIEGLVVPGIATMEAEELRTIVRAFLVAIHERE